MAREEIQLNTVAPQAQVVQPADIYSRPYHDRSAGSGYMELAKSLGVLGDTLAAKQKASQSDANQAYYEHYGAMASEFGQPNNSYLITNKSNGIFDLFSTGKGTKMARNRVEEVKGDTSATDDFYNEYGPRLVELPNDPATLQAEIKKIKAEAWAKVHSRGSGPETVAFGDSYFKQLDSHLNSYSAASFSKQAEEYKANEKLSVARAAAKAAAPPPKSNVNLDDHMVGADSSLFSYLSKDKPKSYIHDLNPQFSSAIQRMIESAPPEIKARIKIDSGARTPERQAELIAAELSGPQLAVFQGLVKSKGAVAGAAEWAKLNPDAARARGIGRMIALPGRSLHQHGNAIDFARDPVAEAWLHKNAGRFGLYYPMGHEPWHIELIGARGKNRNVMKNGAVPSREGGLEPESFGPFQPSNPHTTYRGHDNSPNFFDSYYKTMTGVENAAGDPDAQNPLSSAKGFSQFIDSTWIDQYKKVYGDTGETDEQILAQRVDREVDKALAVNYAKENAKVLEEAAIPVNHTTLLMAHQLGAYGAAKVLQAMEDDPSAPIETVLSEKAIKANPQYNGMSVSQVYARAVDKSGGVFANPVSGPKEQATKAYYEGLSTSMLGPVAFTQTFLDGIIDTAKASNNPEYLDAIPDEVLQYPENAAKAQAARESIVAQKRAETTFAQAQNDRANKAFAEKTLNDVAKMIVDDPTVEIPDELKKRILSMPDGGFEVLKKAEDMRKAYLMPTPEQKRKDGYARAQFSQMLIQYANGEDITAEQLKAQLSEIDDPEMYSSAAMELAKYRPVQASIDDPVVKEMKASFFNANFEYVEGTAIKSKDPKSVHAALRMYNTLLAASFAEEPHIDGKIPVRRKIEIMQSIEDEVLKKFGQKEDPPPSDAKNAANEAPTTDEPPAPPMSDEELLQKYSKSKFIGVAPR